MDQNCLSSSNVPDKLLVSIEDNCSDQQHFCEMLFAELTKASAFAEEQPRLIRRYLYLYTLPISQTIGAQTGVDRLTLMSLAQVALGLHIRCLDDLLDQDKPKLQVGSELLRAHGLLEYAKDRLREGNVRWDSSADAIYRQFLLYDQEARAGFRHSFGSFWRRVSPLCIIPELLLERECKSLYRRYCGWSLLEADCDDAIKDWTHNTVTPVTVQLRDHVRGTRLDFEAGAEVVTECHAVSSYELERLKRELQTLGLATWSTILECLAISFHDKTPPHVS